MRLIDADALPKIVLISADGDEALEIVNAFKKMINEAPTIEAEPVIHGKWIWVEDVPLEDGETEYDREARYQCSECDSYDLRLKDSHADYCWSCGAKMDDDEEDCEEEDNDPKHGHWDIFYNDNIPFSFKCSECGQFTIIATKSCPNCGCKMDLDEVNNG